LFRQHGATPKSFPALGVRHPNLHNASLKLTNALAKILNPKKSKYGARQTDHALWRNVQPKPKSLALERFRLKIESRIPQTMHAGYIGNWKGSDFTYC